MASEERSWPELGQLVSLIVEQKTSTRAELARITGLARSTISQRIEDLLGFGVLVESGEGPSSGGRRPTLLALNPAAGVVLAADFGSSHARLAMATLSGQPEAERAVEIDIADGAVKLLSWLVDSFHEMLEEKGRSSREVRAIGIGVPGTVDFATGTVLWIMPGWDGTVVPEVLSKHFDVPIIVDNDVNVMCLGEYWSRGLVDEQVMFVKVGTGIGCGVVTNGKVHRGANGAAGDIGHIRVMIPEDVLCVCGNSNCLEAVASGAALVRQLAAEGLDVSHAMDVVRMCQAGDARALRLVRVAGQRIGEVLASIVNFYNPSRIILGGALAGLEDNLLAGIRAVVYERALALATRHLTIETAALSDRSAVLGATILGVQGALTPETISNWVRMQSEI